MVDLPPEAGPVYKGSKGPEGQPVCTRRGVKVILSCEKRHLWWADQPCKNPDCTVCEEALNSRRADRIQKRIGGAGLHAYVFTFPRQWRAFLGPARLQHMRGELYRAVQEVYRRHYGEIGGVVNLHPAGDRCHSCGKEDREKHEYGRLGVCRWCKADAIPGAHFELLIPLEALSWGEDDSKRFAVIDRQVSPEFLGEVKGAWCELLRRAARLLGVDAPTANVHLRWTQGDAKTRHRIRYSARLWPAWSRSSVRQLLRPVYFGLAAPHAGRMVARIWGPNGAAMLDMWRSIVAGRPPIRPSEVTCPECGGELSTLAICQDGSRTWRLFYGFARALVGSGATGRNRGGRAPPFTQEVAHGYC